MLFRFESFWTGSEFAEPSSKHFGNVVYILYAFTMTQWKGGKDKLELPNYNFFTQKFVSKTLKQTFWNLM